jgi:SAM-dependent methyltransferase
MSNPEVLGPVKSILSHVKDDWWANAFNETYLRTDGDVCENPAITEKECLAILENALVANLFSKANQKGSNTDKAEPLRVLDLCSGQGRHSIYLAQQYPSAQFHCHDQSTYLLDLAKNRAEAAGCHNVTFSTGLANQVPGESFYDMVMVLGNSFGYSGLSDDVEVVKQIYKVLKPGGLFILDLPDADSMRTGIKDRSWEWIDGRDSIALISQGASAESIGEGKKLLACRERELNSEKDKLAAREIVIDMEQGVVADLFYGIKIYELHEMDTLLEQQGLSTGGMKASQTDRPESHRNEDLGMMEHRNLIVAQKPNFTAILGEVKDDLTFYVNPNLVILRDPYKGSVISTSTHIKAGTLLMIDKPHALVPGVDPVAGDDVNCSRYECSRRMPRSSIGPVCHCYLHVVWCDDNCKKLDEKRHSFECSWLESHAAKLYDQSTYDFNMLWLVLRILVKRHLELSGLLTPEQNIPENVAIFGNNDWKTWWGLLSNREKSPVERIDHWTWLVETYLGKSPLLTAGLSVSDIVDIICKEETNAFCLYPIATGIFPVPGPHTTRGVVYGLGAYTRATLVNHSCLPNVSTARK